MTGGGDKAVALSPLAPVGVITTTLGHAECLECHVAQACSVSCPLSSSTATRCVSSVEHICACVDEDARDSIQSFEACNVQRRVPLGSASRTDLSATDDELLAQLRLVRRCCRVECRTSRRGAQAGCARSSSEKLIDKCGVPSECCHVKQCLAKWRRCFRIFASGAAGISFRLGALGIDANV